MIGGGTSEPPDTEGVDVSMGGCWESAAMAGRSVEVGGATLGAGCCAAGPWRLWGSVEAELSPEESSNR